MGPEALAAISLSIPIVALIFSTEIMLGAGASVRCGYYLGEGDSGNASRIFSQAIMTVFLSVALMSLVALFFLDSLVGWLGADEVLAPLLREYLLYIILFNLFLPSGFVLNYFVSLDGNPVLASASMFVTAVTNIFLSWLMVTQLDMGVAGVAIGSGVGYFAGFLLLLVGHFGFTRKRQLRWNCIRDKWTEVFTASKNGISEGINDLSEGVTMLVFNWVIMLEFGAPGLVALAIAYVILDVQATLVFGFGDALQQLISVNQGAGKPKRVASFLRLAVYSSLLIGLLSMVVGGLYSDYITNFFVAQGELVDYELVASVLLLISPVFVLGGLNTVLTAYFTGLEKPLYSGLIVLMGTLVFPLGALLILTYMYGGIGAFWAISVAELMTLLLALWLYRKNRSQNALLA